ncbi:TPA: hypothetical protein SGW21_002253 [Staphylococcus aureus]|nr:hypothetical protein [Staphylococcus haemolyticus]HCV2365119.1 hypothetical protein [Staphylococcus aureus]MDO0971665.1 hypothetical protein [Staphylococcus haemolyticus]HCV6078113.1 hypothetical protein [Staphylococcus aureus]HDJ5786356.1 hypothetical protein [Staphylococcus aureus]HEH3546679.1 hypothetical protein [Staphylococcus aureus]
MNKLEFYQSIRKDLREQLKTAKDEKKAFLESELEEVNNAISIVIKRGY